ncbi:ABC transporter substrate-binding protein [Sandaracinus amylolyticus]|uniref:Branched-chain amino acid ABC transporter, amino acid-binding protein n=1 Tax=Sandaracinus amylolyticus TaxID=927083 RepID=A0A0F6SI89_9BACT|nr:ABC transporter substrate-binding protein [Sandaracinus amylolyticus]AKF11774.1 Branched-chain amino acid ABC transporter, amino acid-binding protein [Sandaracinus amylolyticus]
MNARSLVVFATLLLALLGCAPERTLPTDDTATVRIGMIAPLSGELGADGPDWRDSARLAVREVNSAGGVLPGRRVELIIADGESRSDIGVAVAQDMIDDGVVAIIGDSASSATIAVYEVTRPAGVLLASGLSTSPLLTEINGALEPAQRFFLRTVPPDDRQAPALAEAMYSQGCRNVSVLFADNDYGRPFYERTSMRFTALGGMVTPAAGVPYTEELSSYRDEVMAIASAQPPPDCVALIGYPASAGIIMRDWDSLSTKPEVTWFGTDGVRQPGFATEVGNTALIDDFYGTAPVTDPETPAYNRFHDQFFATFGNDPVAFSSTVYDAAALVLLAIAKAGTADDPNAIRDAVFQLNDASGVVVQAGRLAEGLRLIREGRPINYEGAAGPSDIDAFGDAELAYELWRFEADGETFERVRILE